MSWHRLRKSLRIVLFALLAGLPAILVRAQGTLRLQLSDPDLSSFPLVRLHAQVLDEAGVRIKDLRVSDLTLVEDGDTIPNPQLSQETVGAQMIFAINTDVGLRIRDSLGRSRFDLAKSALLAWWNKAPFSQLGIDDLTLLTNDSTLVLHGDSMAELASSLDSTVPAFTQVDSGYELLFRALDYVNALDPGSAKPSSLIFVTSLLRQPRDIPLTNIITRARSTETAIYPILMGETTDEDQPEIEILLSLAEETGGNLVRFQESVGLQDLADVLLSQRQQYVLTYRSAAAESGPHEIQVTLGEEAASATSSYVLQIEPAEVTLLKVPDRIERGSDDPGMALEELPPTSANFEYAVSFPDGYIRPITASRLVIDGETVAQSGEQPFNRLEWDLRSVLVTSQHTVQIAVTDSLGLEGISAPATISLVVQLPPRGLSAIRPALGSLLLALGVLLAGVLFAALLITSRRPRTRSSREVVGDLRPQLLRGTALQRELPDQPIEAFLVPFDSSDEYIPLTGIDVILGRDPSHAAVPIDDPSVERMHARLIRQADGEYLIRDQGTIAGTWINFEEVPASGQRLRHGDLVHLGSAGFRFELATAPPPRRIRVEPVHDHNRTTQTDGDRNP